MKRKVCLLLAAIMAFSLAGCGGGGSGSSSGSAGKPPANIVASPTKKLEAEYQKRLALYQEYYEKEKSGNSKYEVGGLISLDSDGLPLMWLAFGSEGGGKKDVVSTQLVGVKDGKAEVLAERRELLYPNVGCYSIVANTMRPDGAESVTYLIYDKEKQDFVSIKDMSGIYGAQVSELPEDELKNVLEHWNAIRNVAMVYATSYYSSRENRMAVNIGGRPVVDDIYIALLQLGILGYEEDEDGNRFLILKFGHKSSVILEYWNKLEDSGVSPEELGLTDYSDTVKKWPEGLPILMPFYGSDGKVYDNLSSFGYAFSGMGPSEAGFNLFLGSLDFERAMRDLQKNPVYTCGDLVCYYLSAFGDYKIVEPVFEYNEAKGELKVSVPE